VESLESQEQTFHPSHEPLGNLAKSGRDSHIPTAPATRLMEKWKTKTRFPTFPQPPYTLALKQNKTSGGGLRPAPNEIRNAEAGRC
jgi:hypothetical protein